MMITIDQWAFEKRCRERDGHPRCDTVGCLQYAEFEFTDGLTWITRACRFHVDHYSDIYAVGASWGATRGRMQQNPLQRSQPC